MKLGEALGAVPALKQESAAMGDFRERVGEIARFAGEDQGRIAFEPFLDTLSVNGVHINRCLTHLLRAPTVGRPCRAHGACPARPSTGAFSLPGTGS